MPVNLTAPSPETLHAVKGIELGVAQAGIRKQGRKDVTLMRLVPSTSIGAVFTKNRFCAAPVQVCREHLASTDNGIEAIIINTGNANAGTGAQGLANAKAVCQAVGFPLGLTATQVLPFSTGVIMEQLPVDRVVAGSQMALANLSPTGWFDAAQAIMTTDTIPKAKSVQLHIDGQLVTITGIAKGAGMIRPNMATMLGFIATDACIAPELVQDLCLELANQSFNRVTVDGDTSTNDSMLLMVTHQAAHPPIANWNVPQAQQLKAALLEVAQHLAHALVRDGEGATKFIRIDIKGGRDTAECLQVAYAIAHSPLVKTAFFASDPNLGRILAAVGYAGVADLDQSLIEMHLDDVHVVTQGGRHPDYREEDGVRVMAQSEINIRIDLKRGAVADTVWTCDFSHDYVTINADYRS